MRFPLSRPLALLSFVVFLPALAAQVDWPAFLARHDLVWSKLPARWEEGAFIGNGRLGANIFVQEGTFAWEVNRTDVSHSGSSGAQRYPMGRAALKTKGRVTGGNVRVDLWNAEARGTVRTDQGQVAWRSFTATEPGVIVIELESTGGEEADLAWIPAKAVPPREAYRKSAVPEDLQHPEAVVQQSELGTTTVQEFRGGGAFAVTLGQGKSTGSTRTVLISVGYAAQPAAAVAEAQADSKRASAQNATALADQHRRWWHAYYPVSFVSFPDARLESFYWIQVYKLGSAMRADGPVLDLMGPWFRATPWPRIWWNLNVQLTYAPLMVANRLDLAESLFSNLDRKRDQLRANAPEALRPDAAVIGRSSGPEMDRPVDLATGGSGAGLEAGNLPWVMFLYWKFYRVQMDDAILRDRVMPLLAPTMGFYLGYLKKDANGKYHLPKTHSPEFADVPDANYDLGFLKWGLQTLIASCERLKLDDPRLPRWREVLANLTPFPVDQTGLMIGAGRNLDASHRHYSHLVAIYPLHLLTPDDPANRALTQKSLAHWFSMPEAHKGYSNTGAASMHAMLGDGAAAVDQLNRLLNTWIHPNTLYTEAGPVIETPLSAMSSIHELFLQDWGGKLRVFPAVPATWSDASFAKLRADGGFIVSAVRRGGKTVSVEIESVGAEPCRVLIPGWQMPVVRQHSGGATPAVKKTGDGEFTVELKKGERVVLTPDATTPLLAPTPVATPASEQNPYADRYGNTTTATKVQGVDF